MPQTQNDQVATIFPFSPKHARFQQFVQHVVRHASGAPVSTEQVSRTNLTTHDVTHSHVQYTRVTHLQHTHTSVTHVRHNTPTHSTQQATAHEQLWFQICRCYSCCIAELLCRLVSVLVSGSTSNITSSLNLLAYLCAFNIAGRIACLPH